MGEMKGNRAEILGKIQSRAAKDPNFKNQLKHNPQSVCKQYGVELSQDELKKLTGGISPLGL